MSTTTQIEWTDATWNPVTGCTKVTPGCDICYAERFSERFRGVAGHPFENGFELTLRPERLTHPLSWKQPRRVFVNSMSDLFHKEIPKVFVDSVFDTMEAADWHTFQVLTKRSSLMTRYLRGRYPPFFGEGRTNRGFTDLRGRPERAAQIEECAESPALKALLVTLAQRDSQLFSLGCDLGAHQETDGAVTDFIAGGYIDVVASEYDRRSDDDYRELAEAVEAIMATDVGRYRWEVNFGLKYCCMKLDGNTADDVVPLLSIGFFAASPSPEGAVESREVLLTSVLRALETVSSSFGDRRDDVEAA